MEIKVALVGNPNSGKTTMFNNLTGSAEYVGNWPGVTVERKEGKLKGYDDIRIVDLPGVYSLYPYTMEEIVTRDFLINENVDIIINILDASNLERNLYLTTQLMELDIPIVVALNMMDVVNDNGDTINIKRLSDELGLEVKEVIASRGEGLKELSKIVSDMSKVEYKARNLKIYDSNTSDLINKISLILENKDRKHKNYFLIKVMEHNENIINYLNLSEDKKNEIYTLVNNIELAENDDIESIITKQRYDYITEIKKDILVRQDNGLTITEKIDKIITNRFLGLPIFAFVMWFIYYISISTVGIMLTDWVNNVLFGGVLREVTTNVLTSLGVSAWLISLIVDGILSGIGAVLGFVPQMFILFFFLSILEDCGYMARVTFILDRLFRRFGLSGKSFIPLLISSGCGVPGLMATRTIENEDDRRLTIMVTTFIPCSAKLPIIALMAGVFFNGSSIVATSIYFLAIFMIIVSAVIIKKFRIFNSDPSTFIMELPRYHVPKFKNILIRVWDRVRAFIVKSGIVIFISSIVIWFLTNFNIHMEMVDAEDSILAFLGGIIAPIFVPLGFGTWQATVAIFAGLIGKEQLVGTFGVIFAGYDSSSYNTSMQQGLESIFTPLSAYSFIVFNMLCAPCIAAMATIRREMGSAKWTAIAIGYQMGLAYVTSLLIYQIGSLIF